MLHPRAKTMLTFGIPALVIGCGCSIILVAVMRFAQALQILLWQKIPNVLSINTQSAGWTLFMLTLTGIAVGALIRNMPGHAGPDPASESLIGMPVPPVALPGLLLALVIGLAGGVSLGPENPITAINIAVAVAAGARLLPRVPAVDWIILAAAGTLGALFGAPVAAALIFSQTLNSSNDLPLWDRLFPPLLAAAAGAMTSNLFFEPDFSLNLAPYSAPHLVDILSGSLVTLMAIALGMLAVWCFPHLHHLFHRLRNPIIMLGIGGFVLGLLALIGGQITLFRGFDEMKLLAQSSDSLSLGQLLAITISKLAALVVAAACGFRGGRIFPALFVGVSLGLMLHNHVDSVPAAITVSCAVMGLVLVVTRDGWLSLFLALAVVPDIKLLPVLCIVMLPAWMILAGKPLMLVARNGKTRESDIK
ncbi:ion channel protein [Rahnella sp. SAP-1]|uniref:Putative ion-transport protein GW590_20080 n=1 Tax=Rouxiella aceris TaxID=2703884 RepID=A0A848MT71_9GAMM|nr:ion channel protein [Rouxiella aceris]NMP29154.1 ion channel protein [Rouxiella aceris]